MSLLNTIKADQLAARKARDTLKIDLLTTFLGDAVAVGKNAGRDTTEQEVVALVKKYIKNTTEVLNAFGPIEGGPVMRPLAELAILNAYLPTQFTEERLTQVVGSIKNEINASSKDLGKVMALLKTRFEGQYDGKMASTVVKAVLA